MCPNTTPFVFSFRLRVRTLCKRLKRAYRILSAGPLLLLSFACYANALDIVTIIRHTIASNLFI